MDVCSFYGCSFQMISVTQMSLLSLPASETILNSYDQVQYADFINW